MVGSTASLVHCFPDIFGWNRMVPYKWWGEYSCTDADGYFLHFDECTGGDSQFNNRNVKEKGKDEVF